MKFFGWGIEVVERFIPHVEPRINDDGFSGRDRVVLAAVISLERFLVWAQARNQRRVALILDPDHAPRAFSVLPQGDIHRLEPMIPVHD